ncbi:low molecular weight protein-tyrosine-phosphatase [Gemmobacter serpentinus]|uniref:low molecular weight protein-tyrosine-phosphatase n=1 Tax=Gemmobacter serpentinus TaxID=2652247 RepID=UPI00124CE3B9|nr:low molecular weight protein-tyrosine-phosphatase [Gemmobacter serpentinus]
MTHRILFVCLGNICRSPTAEAVFRARAATAGLVTQVDSAGTGGWHAGEAPHPPMIAAAHARGYDLTSLRARQLRADDFSRFDHVLVMDRQNLRDAQALRRKTGQGVEPRLFLDLAPGCGHVEMPDPWYTGTFDLTIDLCEAASDGLIAALHK